MAIQQDKGIMPIFCLFGGLMLLLILSLPFWAWGTTWRGQRLGIAQPGVGDVGWADINDRNHLMTEIVLAPILDGHLVVSGATPYDGGGMVISWAAGTVKFKGVERLLASGSTTLGNNDVNWISAVTIEGSSGATIQVNTGEAYPPSSVSGYYTPLAIAFVEAGDIVRMGDLRYRPETKHAMDQDVDSGATPTFQGVYVVDMADAAKGNYRSGLTVPATADPTPTAAGQIAYNTADHALALGDGSVTRAISTGATIQVIIPNPTTSLSDPDDCVIWKNQTGHDFVVQRVYVVSDTADVDLNLRTGATNYGETYEAGTDFLMGVLTDTDAGPGAYADEYTSGSTTIEKGKALIMDFSDSAAPGRIRITLGGYLAAN